ncbi:MAG: Cof-type HAD-IIB family hydrolase [Actinomycetes bacterium]
MAATSSGQRARRAPWLVATDLDGTVVRSDGTISPRTVAALARVEDAGAGLVFVTGRPPRWMHPVAEATGHHGLAICANGAVVYDMHAERVVASHEIAGPVVRDVVARLRDALPGVGFAVERLTGLAYEESYRPRWRTAATPVDDLDDVLTADEPDDPVVKLLARLEDMAADDLLASARSVAGDGVELTHANSADCLLEISAAGVSKATTLAGLCADRGVDAQDVLAFGDMPNDLPLLAWAGTAYAVANAHPDVLAAVTLHTAANDEDGVAEVLERYFPPPPRS